MFAELLAAFRAGDREEVSALWTAFEAGLEAHMALEEECILPEFAKVDSQEARALSQEHEEIRRCLNELGLGVDLHSTNAQAAERFIRTLEAHAKREDALMYRWARSGLQTEGQTSLRAKLLAALRKLVGAERLDEKRQDFPENDGVVLRTEEHPSIEKGESP
jgi:hemerythrin-like domain-containing protein